MKTEKYLCMECGNSVTVQLSGDFSASGEIIERITDAYCFTCGEDKRRVYREVTETTVVEHGVTEILPIS